MELTVRQKIVIIIRQEFRRLQHIKMMRWVMVSNKTIKHQRPKDKDVNKNQNIGLS